MTGGGYPPLLTVRFTCAPLASDLPAAWLWEIT
jgi:hypothetical protein